MTERFPDTNFLRVIVPNILIEQTRETLVEAGIMLNPSVSDAFVQSPDDKRNIGTLIEGIGTVEGCSKAIGMIPELVESNRELKESLSEEERILFQSSHIHKN